MKRTMNKIANSFAMWCTVKTFKIMKFLGVISTWKATWLLAKDLDVIDKIFPIK